MMNLVETFCEAEGDKKLRAGVILTDLLSYSWDRFCLQKKLDVSSTFLNTLQSIITSVAALETEDYKLRNI